WPGRDALFLILLATMMLPGQVTLIPVFAIFRALGWVDTIKPLVVPQFLGTAFYIFMLRQFFMTIPLELSDAARMDGCSEWDIYRRVILPLARPALATVGLFTFINAWNDFLGPLIYLNDDRKATLSLGLQQFVSQHGAEWSMLMAASTLMTLPIIVLFFFAQRTFIQGITLTGVKG
ncbi:MAG: carbohydrate ABC transporter permease, partial [Actinomycetota bacterium]